MKRSIEQVEGTIAHFKELHVLRIDRIGAVPDNENTSVGFRTDKEIDDASVQKLVGRKKSEGLFHVRARWAIHPAFAYAQPSRVRKNRALHGKLGAIGKRGNHG